jgi:hypothetical protein
MGELVARALDGDDAMGEATLAARSYVDEFTTRVLAALARERTQSATNGHAAGAPGQAELRTELAWAACRSLATEARAARPASPISTDDVATLAGLDHEAP